MAENTKIEWATHTFNPWIGCAKVASGCTNCYAEAMAGRLGVVWGPDGTRRRTAETTWKQVERWNRHAAEASRMHSEYLAEMDLAYSVLGSPERPRVFPSLCDIFEDWGGQVLCSDGSPLTIPKYASNGGHMAYPEVCYSSREALEKARIELFLGEKSSVTKHVVKGFAVQFPDGRLAIASGSDPVPLIRRTKSKAETFARELASRGEAGGKPVRVVVSVSVLDSPA